MLSQEEAVYFTSEVLGIEKPIERKRADALTFLNELIVRFQEVIPFQSLSLIAESPHLRRRPTLEEIKRDVMCRKGGLCYGLNAFMKFLLEALEYDVYFVIADIAAPENHMITIVRNLNSDGGDQYLVDVGVGWPTLEAIPLDFVYKHSFLEYKFAREGQKLSRWHRTSSKTDVDTLPVKKEDVEGNWKRVVKIDMTPRNLTYFDAPMDVVYTSAAASPFHTSLRIVSYAGQKAVCIKDMSLLLEDDNHTLCEIKVTDEKAFLQTVQEYFPQLYSTAADSLKNYA